MDHIIYQNSEVMENYINGGGVGVRRGAWSQEEDTILRNCINKFGEGRWHLVPLRAGLKRCRKSCRLRWLNYLRPNLKRGYFSKDEVDLVVRLHKLLGNKWSLIAGRIPGRTANDIKNFWNTHIAKNKKKSRPPSSSSSSAGKIITKNNIWRPRPRKLSSNSQLSAWSAQLARSNLIKPRNNIDDDDPATKKKKPSSSSSSSPISPPVVEILAVDDDRNGNIPMNAASMSLEEDLDECIRWWGDLLDMAENGADQTPFLFPGDDELPINGDACG